MNPVPEKVRDLLFRKGEFFDPRDALQVKFQMLRRVSIENTSVTEASDEYGVSRPTYYQARANFEEAGMPRKRGPTVHTRFVEGVGVPQGTAQPRFTAQGAGVPLA